MDSRSSKLYTALGALALLWIAVYWYTPGPEAIRSVRFDEQPTLVLEDQADPLAKPDDLAPAPPSPPHGSGPSDSGTAEESGSKPGLTGVIPPSFYRYRVRAGDTAERISRRFYSTAEHWSALMRANPKTDFQHLRSGMTILVPVDPKNIQGKPAAPTPPGPVPAPEPAIDYKVAEGDTLSEIAQRFYGRASAWPRIVEANRRALGPDGSKLRSGMVIKIPPAGQPAASR